MFQPMNTSDDDTAKRKVLLYGHHGWGKTTQLKYFQEEYGPGFIFSGESGLSSIRQAKIDYLPFSSWDDPSDPKAGKYSFRDIFKWTKSEDFKKKGYKWIGIDSLTELSDLSYAHAEREQKELADKLGKKHADGFAVWGNHASQLIGACKAIRDMNMHVIVTSLAKESTDDNGNVDYWAMVAGKATMQQLPGIFDCVFCGVRVTQEVEGRQRVERYVITDEVRGWHGKVRDEKRRLKPVEKTGNIVDLLKRLDMDDAEYNKLNQKGETANGV
tara:strand:+ start:158 stop:973 length:816 start_codon:yes stop_codon:yes gene_type:complete